MKNSKGGMILKAFDKGRERSEGHTAREAHSSRIKNKHKSYEVPKITVKVVRDCRSGTAIIQTMKLAFVTSSSILVLFSLVSFPLTVLQQNL